MLSERISLALERARQIHGDQRRRGMEVPYVAHLLGVASIVLNDGGTEDQAIAALLHDTVEDHGADVTFEGLAEEFGQRVAHIVRACTEPPAAGTPSWRDVKARYIAHIVQAPDEARRVILADKIDNARHVADAMARWGDEYWTRFAAPSREDMRWYQNALKSSLKDWPDSPLHREFNRLVENSAV